MRPPEVMILEMRHRLAQTVVLVGLLLVPCLMYLAKEPAASAPVSIPPAASLKVDFVRDIQPILSQSCYACHGPAMQMSSFRLDQKQSAMAGGNSGQVIKPGDSANSKLIHLVAGVLKDAVMPPEGERLSKEQIGLLRAWIDQGAGWPEEKVSSAESTSVAKSNHWAFQPVKRPVAPQVRKASWVRNPIDRFVLQRLERERISPSPEALRATLIRRVSLDLTGLPPTPQEVSAFLADRTPQAYERLVDRLLDSKHYGEKWARPWLDLARYADSDGYEKDKPRPHAWRYRQWVIDALNRNLPFDQFTIEQLAGDLLPNATLDQRIAVGFNRNTLTNREGGIDLEEFRTEQVLDRTTTLGTVWLGLTVGCARCHDHKYDPIKQREVYQLFACFNTAKEINIEAPIPGEIGPYLSKKPDRDMERQALLREYRVLELMPDWEKATLEAAAHPGINVPYDVAWDTVGKMVDHGHEILRKQHGHRSQKEQDKLTDHFVQYYGIVLQKEQYKELKFSDLLKKLAELEERYPALTEAQTFIENPNPPKAHVLIRGDFRQPGVEVQPGTLAILAPLPRGPEPARLRLARWVVSRNNPLTARVTVNRMWNEFFGQGLVATSEDFGTRGDLPTHPMLLDWLAATFMDTSWDVKRMHKLIVMSATYRQSSDTRQELEARDRQNKLLARQQRLRLPAELVRDAALFASGLLDPTVGGRSIRPPLPPGVADLSYGSGVQWKLSQGAEQYRRGLYIHFQRTVPYPQLMNFDAPSSLLACSRRERSTTPLQALNLLNDPVFFQAAQGLATRVLRENLGSPSDRLDYVFQLCVGRWPEPDERDRLLQFYKQQKEILARKPELAAGLFPAQGVEGLNSTEAAAWVSVSRVLLNLDEFITRG
jgi:Protein of unknown function (DUF1553)/Protein of unknown function (DUF1549)/Planctomycete cytochrome C